MRIEPFSPRDTSRVCQAISKEGKWKATRAGRRVRFERYQSLVEKGIAWFVRIQGKTICGIEPTVKDAIDAASLRIKTAPPVMRARKTVEA